MLVNSPTDEPPGLSLPPPKALCTSDITLVTLCVALITTFQTLGMLVIELFTFPAVALALSVALNTELQPLGIFKIEFLAVFALLDVLSVALRFVFFSLGTLLTLFLTLLHLHYHLL